MPLYEYQCSACAHRFERIVKFSDAPLTTCPQCGKETAKQMISAPAVQFKGSGWYVTDYARKGSAPSSTKSEASSDTVSASKESGSGKTGSAATAASGSAEKSSGSASSSSTGGNSGGSSANSGNHGAKK
jgi:putative FmdB family regulatory protein